MINHNNEIRTKERRKPLAKLKEKFYFQLCSYSCVSENTANDDENDSK